MHYQCVRLIQMFHVRGYDLVMFPDLRETKQKKYGKRKEKHTADDGDWFL